MLPRPLDGGRYRPQLSYHAVCKASDVLQWDSKFLFDMLHEVVEAAEPISETKFRELCPTSVYRSHCTYLYNEARGLVFPVANDTIITILLAHKESV